MSKNTEKWDRSGFNELIREDKQKINDFKKTEIYKTNKELRLNENTSTIKYNEPINNNFQNSKQQTPITKTSDFKDENKSNKQFYNNYNNFKQKRRKNNVIETSKERKVTEKANEESQIPIKSIDHQRTTQNLNSNINNFKKNYFNNKNNNFNRVKNNTEFENNGRKKVYNRSYRNFHEKINQDPVFQFKDPSNFAQQDSFSGFLNMNIRNPNFYHPMNNNLYTNNYINSYDPLNNNVSFISQDYNSIQLSQPNYYSETIQKNDLSEMAMQKKPFKKFVEELIKSNTKKDIRLNLSNQSKTKEEILYNEVNSTNSLDINEKYRDCQLSIDSVNQTNSMNEFQNQIFSKYPSFFPYNPMYNQLKHEQNLNCNNVYNPNTIVPHDSEINGPVEITKNGHMPYYKNLSIKNNMFNYINMPKNCNKQPESARETIIKNSESHNTSLNTETTKLDANTSIEKEIKETVDEEKLPNANKIESMINNIEDKIESKNTEISTTTKDFEEDPSTMKNEVLLIVNIKISDTITKPFKLSKNDDIFTVIKRFCKEENLTESLVNPVYIKILTALNTLKEIKESIVSESIISLLDQASYIYKNRDFSFENDIDYDVNNEELSSNT